MSASELAKLVHARPFSPLLVQMSDGRSYEIRRPGLAIVTPTMIAIGLSPANGSRLAERIVRCPIAEITSVAPVEASTQ
jgi:hypothetical protein